MPVTLKITNYANLNIKERTNLTADVVAGATTLPVLNANNAANHDVILVGGGGETSELRTISSVSGPNSLVTDATTLPHANGGQILILNGSQLKIYRAPDTNGVQPADSAFTSYATANIDPDQPETVYTDVVGSSAYWYKFTYLNTYTSAETALADSGAVRGVGTSNPHYVSIDDIRNEAGFANNPRLTDGMISQKRDFAEAEINAALSGIYPVPFTSPINPMITSIALRLAAGMLLLDMYGRFTATDTNNGQSRIDSARTDLTSLKNGQNVLLDTSGGNTAIGTNNMGFSGFPNSQTVDEYGHNDFMFKRTDIDGYTGRNY